MSAPTNSKERVKRTLNEFESVHDPETKSSRLGKGSFASVKLVREKKSKAIYALKIMSTNPAKVSRSQIQNMLTEVHIHKNLDHPNIIKFYDYIQEGFEMYHLLEFAQNGTLYNFLHKKKLLTPNEVFQFFHQTCLAIQHLHNKDVVHRDLKPENLLLDKDQNIKLCDFGWSARNIKQKRTTFCGTYEYMAPEIVRKKPYDYRVDIWSLGVLLYELSHGEAPYKGRSLDQIIASLSKPTLKFSATLQSEVKDLIEKILQIEPNDRITIDEILAHPWIKYHVSKNQKDDYLELALPKEMVSSKSTPAITDIPIDILSLELKKQESNDRCDHDETLNEHHEATHVPALVITHSNSVNSFDLLSKTEHLPPPDTPVQVNSFISHQQQRSMIPGVTEVIIKPLCERSVSDTLPVPLSAELPKAPTYQNNSEMRKASGSDTRKKLFENDIMSPDFTTKVNTFLNLTCQTPNTNKVTPISNPLAPRSPNRDKNFTAACQYESNYQQGEKMNTTVRQVEPKKMTSREIQQYLKLDIPKSSNENVQVKPGQETVKQNGKQYINIFNPKLKDLSAKEASMNPLHYFAAPTYKINFSCKPKVETSKISPQKYFNFETQTPHDTTTKKNASRYLNETVGRISARKVKTTEKSTYSNMSMISKDAIVRKLNFDSPDNASDIKGLSIVGSATDRVRKQKENKLGIYNKTKVYINLDKLHSHR